MTTRDQSAGCGDGAAAFFGDRARHGEPPRPREGQRAVRLACDFGPPGRSGPIDLAGFTLTHTISNTALTTYGGPVFAGGIIKAGAGTIVGISSVAGDRGRKGQPSYCASKAALNTYLESLRTGRKPTPGAGVTGALTLPPGFKADVLASGLTGATAMEAAADGRIFLCARRGDARHPARRGRS